jgi:alkanesulfonate monooxygenase SsuD/methylene tetrahydromethanopterin reductase-like flavin-dependent oxidoreductase (luciferase family)
MDLGVMIGEAAPLPWDRWRHIVKTVERLGFHSLFRSDHYFGGVQKETIDPYLALVMAANESDRLRLGTMVSPVTFRRPVDVGRMAQQLDALSNGRFVLGLGIGWMKAEHMIYGLDFPSVDERYARLDEAIQLMRELWYSDNGVFDGHFFQVSGTDSQPHPPRGRPPILIGGTGPVRTLGMVATYANEWNATPVTAHRFRELNNTLADHCDRLDRDPTDIRRSMLLFATCGPDHAYRELATRRYLDMVSGGDPNFTLDDAATRGHPPWMGTSQQLVDYLGELADVGVEEVVLENLCHETDEFFEWLAEDVRPHLQRSPSEQLRSKPI